MEFNILLKICEKRGEIKPFIKIVKDVLNMKLEKEEMSDMVNIFNALFDKCFENCDIESLLSLDEIVIEIVNYYIENANTLPNKIKWLSNWENYYNVNIINVVDGKLCLTRCEDMDINKINREVGFFENLWKYNSISNGKIIQKLPFDPDRDLELPSRLLTCLQWQNFIKDNDDIIMDKSMVCCLPYYDGQYRKHKHSYIKHKNTICFPTLDISKRNIYLNDNISIDNEIRNFYKKQAEDMYGVIYLKDNSC